MTRVQKILVLLFTFCFYLQAQAVTMGASGPDQEGDMVGLWSVKYCWLDASATSCTPSDPTLYILHPDHTFIEYSNESGRWDGVWAVESGQVVFRIVQNGRVLYNFTTYTGRLTSEGHMVGSMAEIYAPDHGIWSAEKYKLGNSNIK